MTLPIMLGLYRREYTTNRWPPFPQKKVSMKSLKTLRSVHLNFESWGSDYDWFFFPTEGRERLTPDAIKEYDYSEMDCHVNSRAIPSQRTRSKERLPARKWPKGCRSACTNPYFHISTSVPNTWPPRNATSSRWPMTISPSKKEKGTDREGFHFVSKSLWRWKLGIPGI